MELDLKSRKTEWLSDEEVLNFFEPYSNMGEISVIENTYIVGHKGSGKSFLLKYLSLPLQILRKNQKKEIPFDKKAIGFLIPCHVGQFGGLRDNPNDETLDKNWIKIFTHTFNLNILQVILESLEIIKNEQQKIDDNEIVNFLTDIFKQLKLDLTEITYQKSLDLIEKELGNLEDEYKEDEDKRMRHYTDYTFLYNLRTKFRQHFNKLQNIEPVFLLDEYDDLSTGQQRVINEMIKRRQPAFKMTSLPKNYVVERLRDGEQNDIGHEYNLVDWANKPLTPKSKELTPLKNFLENVWSNRVKHLGINKHLCDILEMPKSPTKRASKRTASELRSINEYNYCGFQNLVIISTGNPLIFLELMQLAVNKAILEGIDVSKQPIPVSIQFDAIQEYSYKMRGQVIHADGKLGRHLRRLVEHLGKYLRLKTENTSDNYRLFTIENSELLDDISYKTIEIGMKKSWLVQDDLGRVSKTEKIRLETMTLNNVLLPTFEIPLSEHQVWQISNREIEDVINFKQLSDIEHDKTTKSMPKNIPLEVYNLIPELHDLIKKDELILFIGSGFSAYAGLPSASNLADILRKELDLTNNSSLRLDDLLQYYENDKQPEGLIKLLKTEFQKNDKSDLSLHKQLFGLGITKIITTNWDELIETTLVESSISFQLVVTKEQVKNCKDKETKVIKIHGDFKNSGLMVGTKTQYEEYTSTHDYMITLLKGLMQNRPVLFLGYSLDDNNFNQIRKLVHTELGSIKKSYAVLPDIIDHQEINLKKNGIIAIKSDLKSIIELLVKEHDKKN